MLISATFLIKWCCHDSGCMGVKTSFLPAFQLTWYTSLTGQTWTYSLDHLLLMLNWLWCWLLRFFLKFHCCHLKSDRLQKLCKMLNGLNHHSEHRKCIFQRGVLYLAICSNSCRRTEVLMFSHLLLEDYSVFMAINFML